MATRATHTHFTSDKGHTHTSTPTLGDRRSRADRPRGELGRGEVDVAQRWADALQRRPAREVGGGVGGAAQRQRVVDAGAA